MRPLATLLSDDGEELRVAEQAGLRGPQRASQASVAPSLLGYGISIWALPAEVMGAMEVLLPPADRFRMRER